MLLAKYHRLDGTNTRILRAESWLDTLPHISLTGHVTERLFFCLLSRKYTTLKEIKEDIRLSGIKQAFAMVRRELWSSTFHFIIHHDFKGVQRSKLTKRAQSSLTATEYEGEESGSQTHRPDPSIDNKLPVRYSVKKSECYNRLAINCFNRSCSFEYSIIVD